MKHQATNILFALLIAVLSACAGSNTGSSNPSSPKETPIQEKLNNSLIDLDISALTFNGVMDEQLVGNIVPEQWVAKVNKVILEDTPSAGHFVSFSASTGQFTYIPPANFSGTISVNLTLLFVDGSEKAGKIILNIHSSLENKVVISTAITSAVAGQIVKFTARKIGQLDYLGSTTNLNIQYSDGTPVERLKTQYSSDYSVLSLPLNLAGTWAALYMEQSNLVFSPNETEKDIYIRLRKSGSLIVAGSLSSGLLVGAPIFVAANVDKLGWQEASKDFTTPILSGECVGPFIANAIDVYGNKVLSPLPIFGDMYSDSSCTTTLNGTTAVVDSLHVYARFNPWGLSNGALQCSVWSYAKRTNAFVDYSVIFRISATISNCQ